MEPGTARFRFLATPPLDFAAVEGDFDWLCAQIAVPVLLRAGQNPAQVVISIADREVAFGDTDADAVQFFELYDFDGAACHWRGF